MTDDSIYGQLKKAGWTWVDGKLIAPKQIEDIIKERDDWEAASRWLAERITQGIYSCCPYHKDCEYHDPNTDCIKPELSQGCWIECSQQAVKEK